MDMFATRTPLLSLTILLAGVALSSCSSRDGGGEASCAAVIEYRGHAYWGSGPLKRDPATTGRLVAGVIPACDDSGGQQPEDPAEPVEVAELADVPLDTAFTWNGAVFVRAGRELPAATRPWFHAPLCRRDAEFDLTADWVGVTRQEQPRFDGDLRPPYRLEVHVTQGPEEYVGATVLVHADAATKPGLGPRDVKSSLWEGGRVTARVECVDGRFHALALRVPEGT
ncbi:MAG TPA: hypothetical protein VEQ83_00595 [Lapillicoccus sp.]|nr:hypothetical protein [Lapillicoccus sp.]